MGRYNSGWFSVASATTYNKASNLGTDPSFMKVTNLYRQSSSYVPRVLVYNWWSGSDSYGAAVGPTDRNNVRARTGTAGVAGANGDLSAPFGSNDLSTVTTGQYCLIADRGW